MGLTEDRENNIWVVTHATPSALIRIEDLEGSRRVSSAADAGRPQAGARPSKRKSGCYAAEASYSRIRLRRTPAWANNHLRVTAMHQASLFFRV